MINDNDKKLLSLLRANARMSTSELARALSVSRSTVQSRLKRLEKDGVIEGYTIIHGDDFQKRLFSAHVLIKVFQKLTAKTNRELKAIPQIDSVYAISGDFDLIAVLSTESTQELSQILDSISNLEGVERTNSSVILETKFNR